jgi:hypothetical protein
MTGTAAASKGSPASTRKIGIVTVFLKDGVEMRVDGGGSSMFGKRNVGRRDLWRSYRQDENVTRKTRAESEESQSF